MKRNMTDSGSFLTGTQTTLLKTICIMLCLTILFSLAGCSRNELNPTDANSNASGSGDANTGDAATSYYDVLSLDLYEGENVSSVSFVGAVQTLDYCAVMVQVALHTDTSQSEEEADAYLDYDYFYAILIYDSLGNKTAQIDLSEVLSEDTQVIGIASKADGTLCFVSSCYDSMAMRIQYKLYSVDASGTMIGNPITLSRTSNDLITDFVIDADGYLYLSRVSGCDVFDSEGKLVYSVENEDLLANLLLMGDSVYIDAQLSDSNQYCLYPFDNEVQCLDDPIDITEETEYNYGGTLSSDNTQLYITTIKGIKSYDLASGDTEQLFLWENVDYVTAGKTNALFVLSGSLYLCFSTTYGSSISSEAYLFTLDEDSTNADKQILTVGGLNISYDVALQTAIVNFNQSNSEYRVQQIDYAQEIDLSTISSESDYDAMMDQMKSQLNLDILSGQGPDIIFGNDYSTLDSYADSGVLLDLNTFIDQDTDFHREDYLENILSLAETDGHLYEFPAAFYTIGLYGPKSIIGDRNGWTIDEFNEMADSLPETILPISGYYTWSTILEELLPNSMGTYVDESTGEVQFCVDSFYQILDFAKTYGSSDDGSNMPEYLPDELMYSGGLALVESRIFGPQSYVEEELWANDAISVVGYPSASANGPSVCFSKLVGISTQSEHPDAAWEFVKTFLGEEVQQTISESSIPMLRTQFEAQIEAAVYLEDDQEYITEKGPLGPMTEEQEQAYRELIEGLDTLGYQDQDIMAIVLEEAPAYFYGQKSAEDVAALIQNRVQTLIDQKG